MSHWWSGLARRRRGVHKLLQRPAGAIVTLVVVVGAAWLLAPLLRGMGPSESLRDRDSGLIAEELEGVNLAFARPELPYSVGVAEENELTRWVSALQEVERVPVEAPDNSLDLAEAEKEVEWRLRFDFQDGSNVWLHVTGEFLAFEPTRSEVWASAPLRDEVRLLATRLEERVYGDLLTWPEVRPHFPVGGHARVRDLETGLSFEVYRHRGDAHADVEPVTTTDTETLKRIYGGEWSWKRRSVVVTLGERQIAGSMNGMPHGWGDIFDNDFVGHFCIHFWQSRVHGTWRQDSGHQLMVLKSAGQLIESLDAADPEELATWTLAAVNHRDPLALRHVAWPALAVGEAFNPLFTRLVLPVRHLAHHGTRLLDADEVSARVEVQLTAYYHHPDPDRGYSLRFVINLLRRSPNDPWRVDLNSLLPLLSPVGAPSSLSTAALNTCS